MTREAEPAPSYFRRLADPDVRGYLLVVFAGLLVVLVALFQKGGPPALLIPLLFAAVGLFLRWTWAPAVVLAVACYLQFFPFILPDPQFLYPTPLRESHFNLADLLFTAAAVVYLAAQYRLYGLADRAVPDERPRGDRQRERAADRRQPATISENEVPRMLWAAALLAFGGQFLWLLLTELEVSLLGFPPVRLRPDDRGRTVALDLPPGLSRFVLFAFAAGGFVLAARLAFGYWRLARLSADEGRMILIDGAWREQRREAARQETWRHWGKLRGRGVIGPAVPWRRVGRRVGRFTRGCMVVAVVFGTLLVAGLLAWVYFFVR